MRCDVTQATFFVLLLDGTLTAQGGTAYKKGCTLGDGGLLAPGAPRAETVVGGAGGGHLGLLM